VTVITAAASSITTVTMITAITIIITATTITAVGGTTGVILPSTLVLLAIKGITKIDTVYDVHPFGGGGE
jgi:hypothetical protein